MSAADRAGTIPAGYRVASTIDLAHGRGPARALQLIALLGIAAFVVPALAGDFPPASAWSTPVVIAATAAAVLAYFALHELTHGVALRLLTGVRPSYAVRLPFLTTGTTAFLGRGAMIVVCLAPFVTWGIVLTVALATLPDAALLTAYVVAAVNLYGSAGDFVQAFVAARTPPGALLRDDGSRTTVVLPAPAR